MSANDPIVILPDSVVLGDGTVIPLQRAVDATYIPRPCELDDDPLEWHVVKIDQYRIDCADGCDGPEPHMHEYRAIDVNPNR